MCRDEPDMLEQRSLLIITHMSPCDSPCRSVCERERREVVSPGPRSQPGTQLTGVRETTQHGESLLLSGLATGLLSPPSQEEPQDQHEEDHCQEDHGGAED